MHLFYVHVASLQLCVLIRHHSCSHFTEAAAGRCLRRSWSDNCVTARSSLTNSTVLHSERRTELSAPSTPFYPNSTMWSDVDVRSESARPHPDHMDLSQVKVEVSSVQQCSVVMSASCRPNTDTNLTALIVSTIHTSSDASVCLHSSDLMALLDQGVVFHVSLD